MYGTSELEKKVGFNYGCRLPGFMNYLLPSPGTSLWYLLQVQAPGTSPRYLLQVQALDTFSRYMPQVPSPGISP